MKFVVTLNNVNLSEVDSIGIRAVDLAVLKLKKLNVPLTFVVRDSALKYFLEENGLTNLNGFGEKPFLEVLNLFNNAILPRELEDELVEAYESLAIDPGAPANNLLNGVSDHPVMVIPSPSYPLPTDDVTGVLQNIRGKDAFLSAVKGVWAVNFSKKMFTYRERAKASDDFALGIIVQKVKKVNQSVIAYSKFDDEINGMNMMVKSFHGLHEFGADEIIGKDVHSVDTNSLMISKSDINAQEFCYEIDFETKEIVKRELKEGGIRQKVNDRQISEVARFVKRAKSFIGEDLKLFVGVRDFYTYVFFVNRIVESSGFVVEERVDTSVIVGAGKHHFETEQEVFVESNETNVMPEIISDEEARKQIIEEEHPELVEYSFVEPGLDEPKNIDADLKKDLEFFDEIEKEEAESSNQDSDSYSEGVMESEVEKGETLLEKVLNIKEIIEQLEEYAVKDDKELYDQEIKKLRDLLDDVRND